MDVRQLKTISNPEVQTFLTKLNDAVVNGLQVVGTDETFTDTYVDDLLRIARLNSFPLRIRYVLNESLILLWYTPIVLMSAFSKSRNQPPCKLYIRDVAYVTSVPDFIIEKKNNGNRNIVVIEVCLLLTVL